MKDPEKEARLSHIRHSLAHLLAITAKDYDPEARLTIGPPTRNGFYYDIEFQKEAPSKKDLKNFEKKMRSLIREGLGFKREEVSEEKARDFFGKNPYKLEIINGIVAEKQPISFYHTGNFTDLCRGGHVESTAEISPEAFKLTDISGAYWRGDEKNPMLTRISGIAFESKEELEDFLTLQEEAKKRDHRKLGKELDLFTFSDLVGPGLPLFTPKGTAMREAIVEKIQSIQKPLGYQNVCIPHITKNDLYKKSGHWEKFGDELFKVKGGSSNTEFVMKPMNCPHHTQIYASSPKSYRDLPVRYAEITMVYRDEQAGELLGLSRVRSITQDDAHIFCTEDQIEDEIKKIISVAKDFYTSLELWSEESVFLSVSVRDPKTPEKYLGDEKTWDQAEMILENLAEKTGIPWEKVEGEAAFYGPKLDFMLKDALGRDWQLATIQLDFVQPVRFGLEYTASDGTKKTPVMIHRAIAGSLERFLSVIIEHFAGAFPFWLAPVQAAVLPISGEQNEYAEKVAEELRVKNIRIESWTGNDSLGKKIREGKKQKIPYLLVVGNKEKDSETVSVESRDNGALGNQTIEEFLKAMTEK
ncbi:MAG TPA: threonine--tRNA ligase [Candidatus Paceibacterota bacterium]|nr:threonine--tRNA ligase [Candidatus Paceibacterota bacterium]